MEIETLPPNRVVHWLNKTAKSISNCPGPSDLEKNYRKNELVCRYDELMEKAKQLNLWNAYCESHGYSKEHNGFDCAA